MTSSSAPTVAAIVLAAGASTRMGANKLLLDVAGEPLLHRGVRTAVAAGLDPVIVVLAPAADDARRALATLPCRTVVNPDPARGQGSSLAVGITALPPETEAAVVILPDMPRVTPEMLTALVARWRYTDAPLVVSDYAGTVAPPALYARRLFPELAALDGESAGKAVIARHAAAAERLAWPRSALADVDVLADLAAARAEADRR